MSTATESQAADDARPAFEFFYAKIIANAELGRAMAVEGIDQEIGLLRAQLSEHGSNHPEDVSLMLKSVQLIVRAVATRYRISGQSKEDFANAVNTTMKSLVKQLMSKEADDV